MSLDVIIPQPPEGVKLPEQAPRVPEALDLDTTGVEAAAKAIGLNRLNGDMLRGIYTIGQAIKQTGALKIGRTILLQAATYSQENIEKCNDVIAATTDPGLLLSAVDSKQACVKTLVEAGSRFINSVEVDGSDDAAPAQQLRTVQPGKMAGPVQVIAQQAVVNTVKQ